MYIITICIYSIPLITSILIYHLNFTIFFNTWYIHQYECVYLKANLPPYPSKGYIEIKYYIIKYYYANTTNTYSLFIYSLISNYLCIINIYVEISIHIFYFQLFEKFARKILLRDNSADNSTNRF